MREEGCDTAREDYIYLFTQLRFLRTGRPRKTMNITFISKITDIFVFYRVI